MSSSDIVVRPVDGRRERCIFLTFPWRIYRDDPLWVPPVLSDRAARIDPERNPIYRHGEVALFIAWQGRRPVGTIGVAVDHYANLRYERPVAVFGFFECLEAYAIARALFDTAAAWARTRGTVILRGPQSFSNSDEPGLLLEGRETPRGLLMGWTAPYYADYVVRYGFRKYRDALAYRVDLTEHVNSMGEFEPPGRLQRVVDYVHERYGDRCRLRTPNLEAWDAELDRVREVYNRALGEVPNFEPMSVEDWRRMATSIRPLLQEELTVLVELDDELVGFGLGLPDINMALRHCNGLRSPWDYLKLWWYGRRLPGVSFKIMALIPEVHGLGLDALVYHHIGQTCRRKGYTWVDLSLTADDNPTTSLLAKRFGAHLDKRYRIYELDIDNARRPRPVTKELRR
jgi:GNAT superfamily N-acetyltransferase